MARIIAIVSAKGGVGKSSLCVGLGMKLAARGRRVLLADTDIALKSLDILLGLSENAVNSWQDVLEGGCSFDRAVLDSGRGVSLLPAPYDCTYSPDAEKFSTVLRESTSQYDYVLIDAPAGLTGGFELAAAAADEAIIVATPDNVSINAAAVAAHRARLLGVSQCALVVNRLNKRIAAHSLDDIIDSVCVRLLGVVPEDRAILKSADGIQANAASKANAAFGRIARGLENETVPLII